MLLLQMVSGSICYLFYDSSFMLVCCFMIASSVFADKQIIFIQKFCCILKYNSCEGTMMRICGWSCHWWLSPSMVLKVAHHHSFCQELMIPYSSEANPSLCYPIFHGNLVKNGDEVDESSRYWWRVAFPRRNLLVQLLLVVLSF